MKKEIAILKILEEPKIGGPQIYALLLSYALRGEVNTTILMPRKDSQDFRALCQSYNIKYKTFPLSRITKELREAARYIMFSFYEIYKLYNFFKSNKAEIIYIAGGSWQFKVLIAGRLANKHIIWHLNDTYIPRFLRCVFSKLSGLADMYIYASERTKDYYEPLIKNPKIGYVIPAPVDTNHFDPNIELENTRDSSLIASWEGKIIVGMVANINPVKGVQDFIKTAANLNKRHNSLYFIIIGPVFKNQSSYFKTLELLCKKEGLLNISFLGSRSDVRPLLKRIDVYLCTSVAESSPISVWEAMSMAKAIVSTNVGDVSRFIEDGLNGCITDSGDIEQITSSVDNLIKNNYLRREFGIKSREVAINRLDVKNCAANHLLAYNRLLGIPAQDKI